MVIYIKSDGTTQVVSPEHIYQGSSVNTITLLTPFPSTVAMQVGFRLPDGSTAGYKPMQYVDTVINGVTVSAYTYQLTAAITAQIGTVGIAFCALFSNGKQTSYLANIEVEKSILPELPPAPSEDVYALILKYLQENSADIEEMQREIIVISTKTNSAYNIASHARVTANEAKEIAQEALDQSKVTGTQVQVRGVFQKTLDFISDPQSQINAKTQVNVDGVGQGLISFVSDPQAQINNLNVEITRVDNSAQQGIAQVDVKAEQGITTANEAKEIAQEALEQSKVTGTQVKVGGVFHPTLDFTSDPQAQIDDLLVELAKKVNKSGDTMTGELTNMFGQAVRGFKTVTSGAILNDVRSGFYSDGYDHYSKSVVVGEGNDKFVLTWDFGGTYSRGLWVRAYSNTNLAVEQKALLIGPTQLEVSTANGWTIGGTSLVAPSPQGVYLVSVSSPIANGVYLAPVGFTIVNNRSFSSLVQRTVSDGGDLFLLTCVYINGNSSWTLRQIPSDATVTITQVAYKKII